MEKLKKTMVLFAVLVVGLTSAQKQAGAMSELSPLQIASLKSKKMTLALDLDQNQQQRVQALLIERIKDKKELQLNREEIRALTKEQRFARREARLQKQIEMKREMKAILTDVQYKRFEKMLASKVKKRGVKKRRMAGRRP